jgi:hypothetical protein
LPALVRQGAGRLGEYLASEPGAALRNIIVFVVELVVTLFALFWDQSWLPGPSAYWTYIPKETQCAILTVSRSNV